MWGKRVKEKIRWNEPGSRFAAWAGLFLVLLAIVSVFVALDDTRLLKAPSSSGGLKSSHEAATLTVSGNHTYYWDEAGPLPIGGFRARLAAWIKATKKPQISIAGDSEASFGDTVLLINEVRLQGIENYQIETETRARP